MSHLHPPTYRSMMDGWFGPSHPLRTLADRISSLDHSSAVSMGLFSGGIAPLNVLANGQAAGWSSVLAPHSATVHGLCTWKGGVNGFLPASSSGTRGLSLLFDPFVDGALLANHSRGSLGGSSVLVLSDFSGAASVLASLSSPVFRPDWAETETSNFLLGKTLGTTGNQIARALLSPQGHITFPQRLAASKLLLWNFFPFLRGSALSVGAGLPTIASAWIDYCLGCLCDFVTATGARQVIVATNKTLQAAIKAAPLPLCNGLPVYFLRHPRSWTGKFVSKVDPPKFTALL